MKVAGTNRTLGARGADMFARGLLATNGAMFTTLGLSAMKVAPHPGLKLFGAGFASIGAGLIMMSTSPSFSTRSTSSLNTANLAA